MTERTAVELACMAPAALDLTFIGLETLPEPGHEHFARGFFRSPGGGALHALAAASLGVRTVAGFSLGGDEAGDFIRAALVDAGADVTEALAARTAVTAVMPLMQDRAMITYQPEDSPNWGAIEVLAPERVLCSVAQLEDLPRAARAFVSVNAWDLERWGRAGLSRGRAVDTLFVNEREAIVLSEARNLERAAEGLAESADIVVITRGGGGALACTSDGLVSVPGIAVEAVDTTGAGDLFVGAWTWADTLGLPVRERLRWAVLYASLSVRVPTGAAGVTTLSRLLDEGRLRGMTIGDVEASSQGAPAQAGAE